MTERKPREFRKDAAASLRLAALSIFVLGGCYTASLWIFGNTVVPFSAQGSLIRNGSGAVVGSRLIAQKFVRRGYFWPRPSAVDFNAAAAGGSNLPPASPELAARIKARIAECEGMPDRPVPVDLLAASGSGLDPHLFPDAVLFQSDRVAAARGLDPGGFRRWVQEWIRSRAGRRRNALVNVLELNIALDERYGPIPGAAVIRSQEDSR